MSLKKVGDINFQDLGFAIILNGETLYCEDFKDCGLIRYRCLAINVMFSHVSFFFLVYFLLFFNFDFLEQIVCTWFVWCLCIELQFTPVECIWYTNQIYEFVLYFQVFWRIFLTVLRVQHNMLNNNSENLC